MPRHRMATALIAALFAAVASADETAPAGSKPLSEVLRSIEKDHAGVITSAEFERTEWEIKTFSHDGRGKKLYVDPKTGHVTRSADERDADKKLPPADAKPLSEVVKKIEAMNAGDVSEIEFDDGVWEADVRKNGNKTTMHFDPKTGGKVTR